MQRCKCATSQSRTAGVVIRRGNRQFAGAGLFQHSCAGNAALASHGDTPAVIAYHNPARQEFAHKVKLCRLREVHIITSQEITIGIRACPALLHMARACSPVPAIRKPHQTCRLCAGQGEAAIRYINPHIPLAEFSEHLIPLGQHLVHLQTCAVCHQAIPAAQQLLPVVDNIQTLQGDI